MKTIGLIGGTSWESTLEYYRIFNETVKARLGGLHSAQCLIYSLEFSEVAPMGAEGRWDELSVVIVEAARKLQRGGADFLMIGANTIHRVAADVEKSVELPLLHIGDATARAILDARLSRVGLLGTRFTMEDDFLRKRLSDKYRIDTVVPDEVGRRIVHDVIYDELCRGVVKDESREAFVKIIRDLGKRGATGVILGCTEIPMLVGPADSPLPVFDTTHIHATAAIDYALMP